MRKNNAVLRQQEKPKFNKDPNHNPYLPLVKNKKRSELQKTIFENLQNEELIKDLLQQRPDLRVWFDSVIPRNFKRKKLPSMPLKNNLQYGGTREEVEKAIKAVRASGKD